MLPAAHTTADIGAHRQRQHACREGHRRAARRATAGQFRIEGVARRTVDEIDRIGARREFRRVGLAHDNRTIGPYSLDQPSSSSGTLSLYMSEPYVERRPATSFASFTPIGKP